MKTILLSFLISFGVMPLFACANGPHQNARGTYSESWWAYVDPKSAPAWEILPQAASKEKGEVILSKRNELGILSNLAETPFTFRGRRYASIEGLWQAMKYPEGPDDERISNLVTWQYTRDQVMAMSGFEAKDSGKLANENMKRLGIKWLTFEKEKIEYNTSDIGKKRHYEVIFAAMKEKLSQNPKVREILLKTGSLRLLPDHNQGPSPAPAYLYPEIWMKLRTELQGK